jgi:hypothetical protein
MNLAMARRSQGQLARRQDTGAIVLIVEAEAGDGVSALVIDGAARESRVPRAQLDLVHESPRDQQ